MIDWVTAALPCSHLPLPTAKVMKVEFTGEITWATPCRTSITGSFESHITVCSGGGDGRGRATHLLISGNPSKFLQGHNVFGSDDLRSLMSDTFNRIIRFLELSPTKLDIRQVEQGDYELFMVDINYSFLLPCRSDVRAWLRAAEFKSRTRHGRPSSKGGTVYWGQGSQRWSLKPIPRARNSRLGGIVYPTH